jgi:beta-glucanase (GH16 family)
MAWSTESFLFGKFEARIKMSTGAGTWSGFWFNCVPECTPPWPAGGEIDVVEHVANPELDAGVGWAHSNLHFEHDASGELDNTTYNTDTRIDPAGGPAGWHTYGLEWVPGEIRFFVDGRRTATHRKSDEGPGGWWPFDTIPEELRFACCSGIGQERLTLRRCRNGWRSTGCGDTGTSDRADSNAHLRPNPWMAGGCPR